MQGILSGILRWPASGHCSPPASVLPHCLQGTGTCFCNNGWGVTDRLGRLNCSLQCPFGLPDATAASSSASSPVPCSRHGTCNVTTANCECLPRFGGKACNITCPGDDPANPCSGHGI